MITVHEHFWQGQQEWHHTSGPGHPAQVIAEAVDAGGGSPQQRAALTEELTRAAAGLGPRGTTVIRRGWSDYTLTQHPAPGLAAPVPQGADTPAGAVGTRTEANGGQGGPLWAR